MVKKWASAGDRPAQQPGLREHLFDLGGDALAEVVGAAAFLAAGCPGRIKVVSHSTRLAANTSTIAVINSPMMSLISVCVSTRASRF